MTALPAVQMLWVEGKLSILERLSITSFLANGHPVHLYTYGLSDEVPKGARVMDAREILAESECFALRSIVGHGSMAPFSNRFRYKLLFERGGIWSDADVVALKPIEVLAAPDYFFATEFAPPAAGADNRLASVISSCLFKVPAGSAIMRDCLNRSMAVEPQAAGWGATGVRLLREAVAQHGLAHAAAATPQWVCPVPFWEITRLLKDAHTLPAEACAIHFYNEIWRRNFFDKNADYEPLCVYERLKAYYLGARESTHA